ncbi:MAG: hypothetical protein GY867_07350 [bacterium]|nr:hypothetical protein [bacterium]
MSKSEKTPKRPRFHEMALQFPEGVTPTKLTVTPTMDVEFEDESGIVAPIAGSLKFAYERINKPLPKV